MIYLIGIGVGDPRLLTEEAKEKILSSDVVIGSKRIIEALPCDFKGERYVEVLASKIKKIIDSLGDKEISVLFSGDSGFYSGCKNLSEIYKERAVILPGIGSLSYMASKIKRPWENVKFLSAHGKKIDTSAYIASNKEVFFLTGGEITAERIIRDAYEKGLNDVVFYVGENLSYANEKIKRGLASQLLDVKFDSLSVVWCVNNATFNSCLHSFDMKDEEFVKENVPITKREIRNSAILELRLKKVGTFYDIGGGTGSVSVAVSKASPFIDIYTIERKENACKVIEQNFAKHNVINGHLMHGIAPKALENLPPADYAFIGGSAGNLESIIEVLLSKNPEMRIVITALTLETVCEIKNILAKFNIENWDGRQIQVNEIKALGSYNALTAQNPIFLFSFGGHDEL